MLKRNNILGNWWWTVDRFLLFTLVGLIIFGSIITIAASPWVAGRLNLPPMYFVKKHAVFILPCVLCLFVTSAMSSRAILICSIWGLLICWLLCFATMFIGYEIKGAKRWIRLYGLSIQPSEFLRTFFSVIIGQILSQETNIRFLQAFAIYGACIALLVLQPDFGMTFLITIVVFSQMFIAGLPQIFIALISCMCIGSVFLGYTFLPHVASRIDRFLAPESGDCYQLQKSLEAFARGGMWGVGPGEGEVKKHLPDAHSDFVFAVIGEEFGIITCMVIVIVFAIITIRAAFLIKRQSTRFNVFASVGLLVQFVLQALINISSSLGMIPTKGMNLPLISYGGSSAMAVLIGVGMMLALVRRKNV